MRLESHLSDKKPHGATDGATHRKPDNEARFFLLLFGRAAIPHHDYPRGRREPAARIPAPAGKIPRLRDRIPYRRAPLRHRIARGGGHSGAASVMRPYPFRSLDVSRARATRRAAIAGWSLLIGAGLTLGAMFATAI